jgi:hypothetical protein
MPYKSSIRASFKQNIYLTQSNLKNLIKYFIFIYRNSITTNMAYNHYNKSIILVLGGDSYVKAM